MRTPAVELVSRIVSPVESRVKFSVKIIMNPMVLLISVDESGLLYFEEELELNWVFVAIKRLIAYSVIILWNALRRNS